jgi:hypothetical protein
MSNGFFTEIRARQLPASTTPELGPGDLRPRSDPAVFPFETTAELDPLAGPVGQERATEALRFGVTMRGEGYNLFATPWRI